MTEQVVIEERFRGPPESGHGGYVCGIVAGLIGETSEVTLRGPPPLRRPLKVERPAKRRVALRDGETIVVEGVASGVAIEVPEPVSFVQAREAAKSFLGFDAHPFPTCFGCGPERVEGDGLRIFAGPVEGRDVVAAPWIPDVSLTGEAGAVRPEFIWAALDCPGGFALLPRSADGPVVVLGRLAVEVTATVKHG